MRFSLRYVNEFKIPLETIQSMFSIWSKLNYIRKVFEWAQNVVMQKRKNQKKGSWSVLLVRMSVRESE